MFKITIKVVHAQTDNNARIDLSFAQIDTIQLVNNDIICLDGEKVRLIFKFSLRMNRPES
jgi:hypothetical protein